MEFLRDLAVLAEQLLVLQPPVPGFLHWVIFGCRLRDGFPFLLLPAFPLCFGAALFLPFSCWFSAPIATLLWFCFRHVKQSSFLCRFQTSTPVSLEQVHSSGTGLPMMLGVPWCLRSSAEAATKAGTLSKAARVLPLSFAIAWSPRVC